jgi:hypothetical protein
MPYIPDEENDVTPEELADSVMDAIRRRQRAAEEELLAPDTRPLDPPPPLPTWAVDHLAEPGKEI